MKMLNKLKQDCKAHITVITILCLLNFLMLAYIGVLELENDHYRNEYNRMMIERKVKNNVSLQ